MWHFSGLQDRKVFGFNNQIPVAMSPSETLRSPESYFSRKTIRPPMSECLSVWASIVELYTQCQLTKESDKLIAISAIAGAMEPMMEGRYLAGLWEKDLVNQLAWYIAGEEGRRPTVYRAPSWSWASVEGECILDVLSNDIKPLIEIRSAHVDLANDDELGPVEGGYLDVTGQLLFLGWNAPESQSNLQVPGFYIEARLQTDCSLNKDQGTLHLLPLTIKQHKWGARFTALVLQQCSPQACYQRVSCVGQSLMFSKDSHAPLLKLLGYFKGVGQDNDGTLWSFTRNDSRMQHIRLV